MKKETTIFWASMALIFNVEASKKPDTDKNSPKIEKRDSADENDVCSASNKKRKRKPYSDKKRIPSDIVRNEQNPNLINENRRLVKRYKKNNNYKGTQTQTDKSVFE